MNRKGGLRRKSRQKLTGKIRKKGKINIRGFLQSFKEGDKVQLVADPSHQRGMFHLRFYGKHGVIKSKQGRAYYVAITDQNKNKSVIVHPIHLKKI